MSFALLNISDGETTVSLISQGHGFHVKDWTPRTPEPKNGGVFQSSSLSDGRKLAWRRWDNVIDTFDLAVNGSNMNATIAEARRLRNLLLRAQDYWLTGWATTPVWIEARGSCEENIRYAIIVDWRAQTDDNPYATPLFGDRVSAMDDFTLILEHEVWKDQPPGESSCVAISNQQDWTAIAGSNLVLNPGFQGGNFNNCTNPSQLPFPNDTCVNDPFDDWTAQASGNAYVSRNRASAFAGDSCCWLISSSYLAGSYARILQSIAVSASTDYYFSFYHNADDISVGVYDNTNGAYIITPTVVGPSTGWTYYSFYFTTPPGCLSIQLRFSLTVSSGYIEAFLDEVNLQEGVTLSLGSEETCENQVYIANKQNKANLTHIFNYDASGGGSFGSNLMGTVPYFLFPANPAAGDCVYFGIDSSVPDSGPFFGLVFDIGTAQSGIDTIWEYSVGGGGWDAFEDNYPVGILDTTTVTDATGDHSFDKTGPGAVVWSSDLMSGLVAPVPSSSASRSVSPSASRSESPSSSESPSVSPSLSPSASVSPSAVISAPSDSPSASASASPSESPSTGPSGSESPSASSSKSPSVSPSASASLSPSASVSLSISPSESASPSASASPSFGAGGGAPFFSDIVNGVTGFWVRVRITAVSLPTRPTQINREIYTPTRPYVEVEFDQVDGDLPALMEVNIEDVSMVYTDYKVTRAIIGGRSLHRGSDYTPYLNCSDEQNPEGLTVTLGTYTTFEDDGGSPTGRVARFQRLAGFTSGTSARVTFAFSSGLASQYVGSYRAILRCTQVDGSEDMWVRLGAITGTASFFLSDPKPASWSTPGSVDFGRITIPAMQEYNTAGWSAFSLVIYANKDFTDQGTLDFYDLVLMPVDEWAGEYIASSYPAERGGYSGTDATDLYREYLDVDPLTYPKNRNTALARQVSSGFITLPFKPIAAAPPSLQTRTTQRVWFFQSLHDGGDWWFTERFSITSRVKVNKLQQYLSMRGSG